MFIVFIWFHGFLSFFILGFCIEILYHQNQQVCGFKILCSFTHVNSVVTEILQKKSCTFSTGCFRSKKSSLT